MRPFSQAHAGACQGTFTVTFQMLLLGVMDGCGKTLWYNEEITALYGLMRALRFVTFPCTKKGEE